jgi:hypothetical protein
MFKESSWSKSPSLDTHKEPEKRIFPEEMYTVSGFLSPNSRHYKKAKRFDAAISEVASLCNNIHEVDQLPPEERAAAFKKIFPSVPKGLQQVMLSTVSERSRQFTPQAMIDQTMAVLAEVIKAHSRV